MQPGVAVCDLDDDLTANHLRLRFPELVSPTQVALCSKWGGGLALGQVIQPQFPTKPHLELTTD
jgi:hypothetical protein